MRHKTLFVETGGGKSLSFALPAYVQPESCTVVIQPTKSLQIHTKAALESLNISVHIYNSSYPHASTSVVLVIPEALSYKEWQAFAHRKRIRYEFDRVIFDEVYDMLLSSEGWRPKLPVLHQAIDQISHRQLFLTETLPPSQQDRFLRQLRLNKLSHPKELTILRNNTTRDNLRYEYIDYDAIKNTCLSKIGSGSKDVDGFEGETESPRKAVRFKALSCRSTPISTLFNFRDALYDYAVSFGSLPNLTSFTSYAPCQPINNWLCNKAVKAKIACALFAIIGAWVVKCAQ
ncbi:uncharacterized protein F4812DRAFT_465516 [Daldinia caldariorum]|uniref:uncharacterized protein n=1 Tax=Daldinia caldariorum TaxID=326644 RepID=UPI002007A849|nr:uncharacterized protein F4812DRAFT_465516 [Daldinia caldariorum]KAI1466871.1 hypothetical protein F4812DRAFT_465516 [Daldinia caldariorum]